jgi:hypothetical protein
MSIVFTTNYLTPYRSTSQFLRADETCGRDGRRRGRARVGSTTLRRPRYLGIGAADYCGPQPRPQHDWRRPEHRDSRRWD